MTCERFLNYVDSLEKDDLRIPEALASHIEECQTCARAYNTMKKSLELLSMPFPRPSVDLLPAIMAVIPEMEAPRRAISFRSWILAGVFMMFGMLILPLLSDFTSLNTLYGDGFSLAVALVLGMVISVYGLIFVLSNATELSRFAKNLQERIP